MTAYRIIAVVLTLACLGCALGLFFHQEPIVARYSSWIWKGGALEDFVHSLSPRDRELKIYAVYLIRMGAVLALGAGMLFAISVFKPLLMRPFIVVAIVCALAGIAMSVYCAITLKGLSIYWWLSDAGFGAVVAALLLIFFPKPAPAGGYVYPEDREDYLKE